MAYAEFPSLCTRETVLSELISLYEKLVKEYDTLIKSIAECFSMLKDYQQSIPSYTAKLVSSAIEAYRLELKREIARIEVEISNLSNTIDRRFDKVDSDINLLILKYEELKEAQKNFEEVLNLELSQMRLLVLGSNSRNEKLVDDAIAELTTKIDSIPENSAPVFNPFRMELDTTGNVISDIYNLGITYHGFTALEFTNNTQITCKYFNDSEITCLDWWTHGKEILIKENYMFNPVTGSYEDIRAVIKTLAKELKNNGYLTATEYDEKAITATAYDAVNITANNYDWNGKEILKDV